MKISLPPIVRFTSRPASSASGSPRIFSHLPHVRLHRLPRSRRIAVLHRIQNLLDRKSTRLNSSHQIISYAVFCLKKKTPPQQDPPPRPDDIRHHRTHLTQDST